MNENKIIKIAAYGFVALVIVPTVLSVGIRLSVKGVNAINKIKFDKRIKKGLEDGSIIEIDGEYYETKVNNGEEA